MVCQALTSLRENGSIKAGPGASQRVSISKRECGTVVTTNGWPRCLPSERLPAIIRDVHRTRDPRSRAARAGNSYRLVAPPDGFDNTSYPQADPSRSALPSRIPLPRAAPHLARVAALPSASGLSRGAGRLAGRPVAGPDPEPRPPLRPGPGAGGGVAEKHPPPSCAFPAYTCFSRPLCVDNHLAQLDCFGAR